MYVVPTTNIICNVVHRIGKDRQTKRGKAPSGVGTNDIGKDPKQGLRTWKGQPGVIMVDSSLLESIIINQINNCSYYYYRFNSYFTHIHYSHVYALNCTLYVLGYSLFKFNLVLNSVLPFWKLSAFEFLLGTSEIYLCLLSLIRGENYPSARCVSADNIWSNGDVSILIVLYNGNFLL
jgi:hypothetical protein